MCEEISTRRSDKNEERESWRQLELMLQRGMSFWKYNWRYVVPK